MLEGWGLYLLFSLPALLLGLWAQLKTKSVFQRNARIRTARGMTGAQVARAGVGWEWLVRCES